MFNQTYNEVFKEAREEWKMQRVLKIKIFLKQYPAPPPLNVPCLLLDLLTRLPSALHDLCCTCGCIHIVE